MSTEKGHKKITEFFDPKNPRFFIFFKEDK